MNIYECIRVAELRLDDRPHPPKVEPVIDTMLKTLRLALRHSESPESPNYPRNCHQDAELDVHYFSGDETRCWCGRRTRSEESSRPYLQVIEGGG
jgi:hypothetical protein